MDIKAITSLIEICDQQGFKVQITGPAYSGDIDWVADFSNLGESRLVKEMLKAETHQIHEPPDFYARLV